MPQTETQWTETPRDRDPPEQRPPWAWIPPGQRPTWTETPPGQRHPPGQRPPGQRPPRTETPQDGDPLGQRPPCGQTDTCENISFANFVCGGKIFSTSIH